jgi:hypothetical protein
MPFRSALIATLALVAWLRVFLKSLAMVVVISPMACAVEKLCFLLNNTIWG